MLVVHPGHRRPQRLDPRRGTILTRRRRDRDTRGTREAALDLVVGLGGSLAQVGPRRRVLGVAVF